jgi:hypothetical protein
LNLNLYRIIKAFFISKEKAGAKAPALSFAFKTSGNAGFQAIDIIFQV